MPSSVRNLKVKFCQYNDDIINTLLEIPKFSTLLVRQWILWIKVENELIWWMNKIKLIISFRFLLKIIKSIPNELKKNKQKKRTPPGDRTRGLWIPSINCYELEVQRASTALVGHIRSGHHLSIKHASQPAVDITTEFHRLVAHK